MSKFQAMGGICLIMISAKRKYKRSFPCEDALRGYCHGMQAQKDPLVQVRLLRRTN